MKRKRKVSYLELGPDWDQLLLEFAGAEVEDVQDERELDVLEDFCVDRVPLLELESDHLNG